MTVQKYTVAGRTVGGAIAGALTATGLAVTQDSTGWFALGAGVFTAAGFALWASSRRIQLARMEIDGVLGGTSEEVDRRNRSLDAQAFPESISTLRIVSTTSGQEDLTFRSAVDPVLTKMNVLVTGPRGEFRSSAIHDISFDQLHLLERPREVTVRSQSRRGAQSRGGSVVLHDPVDVEPDEVVDPRGISAPYPAPAPAGRIGRGRRAAIGVCLGFAIAASATSIALPDTGFVQSAGEQMIDAMDGVEGLSEASGELEEALADLAQVNAAAVSHIRSFSMSDTGWTLVAYDASMGQDFSINDYDDTPSYGEPSSNDGTFEIPDESLPNLDAMYAELEKELAADAVRGVEITGPGNGGVPVVMWEVSNDSSITHVSGRLDGSLAKVYDPGDLEAAFGYLEKALERFGSGSGEQVFYRLIIRMPSDGAPSPTSGPDILAQGGAGGVVEIPNGDYAGPGNIAAEVGRFASLVDTDLAAAYESGTPFALADISPEKINAIVDDAIDDVGAADDARQQMTITVDRITGDDGQLTVTVQFANTSPSLYCAGLDGNPSAC